VIPFFYQVLPTKKLPQEFLLYSSESELEVGQVVMVPLQSKTVWGIVWKSEILDKTLQTEKIKPINQILPFKLQIEYLEFLKLFSRNTFNSINISGESLLQPLKLLTNKNWQELEDIKKNNSQLENANLEAKNTIQNNPKTSLNRDKQPTTEYFAETDISLRIIYIIRSLVQNLIKINSSKQILVLFPEKKLLDKILSEFKEIISKFKFESEVEANKFNDLIEIFSYSGDISAASKKTVRNLLIDQKPDLKVIFATRSGLFLPFTDLQEVVLVDEGNTFYIQEQNGIYYDARDVAYFLSIIFKVNLNFVSQLPSSRLYESYLNKFSDNSLMWKSIDAQKPLKIKITERNSKIDDFELFSSAVEDQISGQDKDEFGISYEEVEN
jgi:primosomal protein N'